MHPAASSTLGPAAAPTSSVQRAVETMVASAPAEEAEATLIGRVVTAAVDADVPWIDSHHLARQIVRRREVAADRRLTDDEAVQAKDYTQYVLRSQPAHVCYSEGGQYRIHPVARCGEHCGEHHHRAAPEVRRAVCATCTMQLTTAGCCPMGCDE